MKIDFERLDLMVSAGATGAMIVALLRLEHERDEARKIVKRPKDAKRVKAKRERHKATSGDMRPTPSDTERQAATLSDAPRARLFREGKGALLTLGIAEGRAGGLIAQWLKLTNDDEQLVLAAILKAQSLNAADAPGWILATLKGRTNGPGNSKHQRGGTSDFFAGLAAVASDIAGHDPMAGPADAEIPRGRVEIDG